MSLLQWEKVPNECEADEVFFVQLLTPHPPLPRVPNSSASPKVYSRWRRLRAASLLTDKLPFVTSARFVKQTSCLSLPLGVGEGTSHEVTIGGLGVGESAHKIARPINYRLLTK